MSLFDKTRIALDQGARDQIANELATIQQDFHRMAHSYHAANVGNAAHCLHKNDKVNACVADFAAEFGAPRFAAMAISEAQAAEQFAALPKAAAKDNARSI